MGAIVTAEWMYSVGEVGSSEGCGRTAEEAVATGGSSTKSGYGMPSARRMPLRNRPKQQDCSLASMQRTHSQPMHWRSDHAIYLLFFTRKNYMVGVSLRASRNSSA